MTARTPRTAHAPIPLPASDPVAVRLRLIGQMEAWTLTSQNVLPVGRKTRALLAILASAAPRPMLRTRLSEMLWSKRPEEQARASLRQEIHRLLLALLPAGKSIVIVNRDHLVLRPGVAWVDVDEVMRATPGKPAGLALLDGELLEDLDGVDPAFDIWLAAERQRLRDKARLLAEAMLRGQSEPEMAILAAQQLLNIDRTHEGAWRALMRAHLQLGERGMALQAYERCRAALADLLDAEPSQETQRLMAEIRASGISRPAVPPSAPPQVLPPAARLESRSAARAEPRGDSPGRGGTRIGMLPLQLAGTTDGEAALAAGLSEEITAGLSRDRWLVVVSSSALARFAAQTRDETALRKAFDLHYLIDGSAQILRDRLRLSLRLLDLRGGNQVVWSRRFDRTAADLLAAQDEIAAEAAAQITSDLLQIEALRAAARPAGDLGAHDTMLRAVAMMDRLERPLFQQAGGLLRHAIALDPEYGAPHAWLAVWNALLISQDWAEDAAASTAEAGHLAERAVALDPLDSKALSIAGLIRADLHRRPAEAVALYDRALTLNPNLALTWGLSGAAQAYRGDLDEARLRLDRAHRLAPLHPQGFLIEPARCAVALLRGEMDAAVVSGRSATELNPAYAAARKPYLAALGHLGLHAEAGDVRARLLAAEPGFTVQRFLAATPYELPAHRAKLADGLRAVGVPEG